MIPDTEIERLSEQETGWAAADYGSERFNDSSDSRALASLLRELIAARALLAIEREILDTVPLSIDAHNTPMYKRYVHAIAAYTRTLEAQP